MKIAAAMVDTAGNSQTMISILSLRRINMEGKIPITIATPTSTRHKTQTGVMRINHRISRLTLTTKWDGMTVVINGMIRQTLTRIK